MPKLLIRLDGDRIAEDVCMLEPAGDQIRPFANKLLSAKKRGQVMAVAGRMFDDIFLTMRVILMEELSVMDFDFQPQEFELQTGFIGRFDQNALPLNIEVFANDRPNWYDYKAERSRDLTFKLSKMRRIAELAVETNSGYLASIHKVTWRSNCWLHVGAGYYHETPQ